MACARTFPERTIPKADDMECTADLTEEQHRPNQSALETAPSPRHEATSPPHIETDDTEWDAGRTHRPGQAIHAPAKAPAPPLEAPTQPCLGDDDETEPESDMDEDDDAPGHMYFSGSPIFTFRIPTAENRILTMSYFIMSYRRHPFVSLIIIQINNRGGSDSTPQA